MFKSGNYFKNLMDDEITILLRRLALDKFKHLDFKLELLRGKWLSHMLNSMDAYPDGENIECLRYYTNYFFKNYANKEVFVDVECNRLYIGRVVLDVRLQANYSGKASVIINDNIIESTNIWELYPVKYYWEHLDSMFRSLKDVISPFTRAIKLFENQEKLIEIGVISQWTHV